MSLVNAMPARAEYETGNVRPLLHEIRHALDRLLTEPRVIIFYLSQLLWPHPSRLNLDHDFPVSNSLIDPMTTIFTIITIAALIGLAVVTAKKQRLLSFCILWFFGHLVIE